MTTNEAIEKLDSMQSQIIHGSRIFGDIADLIRKQEQVRLAALRAVADEIDSYHAEDLDSEGDLCLAHRILSTAEPDGVHKGAAVNSANTESTGSSQGG